MQPNYQQPYPAQQYAPPMPQYPQQPPAPQYPTQPAYAPQPYPQQYAAPPAPAGPPPPPGSLDTFYSQPSTGGGPSFKFRDSMGQPQINKSYAGFVARTVTDADVEAQSHNGVISTYKDGRPKFVMKVPMQVQPSQEFPEGLAQWYVKGQARDELARAMAEAGAPQGPPESGAFIQVTLVSVRAVPNMNPQYIYRVVYQRPQGAAPGHVVHAGDHPNTMPVQSPVVEPQPVQQPVYAPAPQPQYAQVQQVPVPAPAPAQVAPGPVPVQQPAAPAPAQAAAPAGFSEEQAALFAKLTGGQTS